MGRNKMERVLNEYDPDRFTFIFLSLLGWSTLIMLISDLGLENKLK